MKISEYIRALEAIQFEHGDLEVDTYVYFGRVSASLPEVAYRKILGKRESRNMFWSEYYSGDADKKGAKVCKI